MFDPATLVSSYNSFAMPLREFLPHITRVLDQLGVPLHARTNFMK